MSDPIDAPEGEAPAEELSLSQTFKILLAASAAFWLVNQVNFFDGIAYFGILNLLTLFIHNEVGLTEQAAGFAVSMFTGGVTAFMFGGGFVSDRLGVRRALTLCLVGLLAGRLLLVLSAGGGEAMLWVALALMAVATGILQPALYAGVKEFTDPRTATIGYSLLYAIMNLGILAESAVSPFLREAGRAASAGADGAEGPSALGITYVFWALVGVTALMLVLHAVLFTRRVEDRDRAAPPAPRDTRPLGERVRELPIFDARFQFFIFILLPVRTLFAHQFLTMPDYITRCYPAEVGDRLEWFQGLNPLIIVIGVPLIAAMTRKANVVTMMIVGTAISAASTFLLAPGPDLRMLIAYIILFSLGEAVWSSRFLEMVADIAPAGKVGAYMGIAGVPWFLAKLTTGLYSGTMIARYLPADGPQDSGTLWLIYAGIACISPVGLLLARGWLGSLQRPAA